MMTIKWQNAALQMVAIRTDDQELLAWMIEVGGYGMKDGDDYFFYVPGEGAYWNIMGHLRGSYHRLLMN